MRLSALCAILPLALAAPERGPANRLVVPESDNLIPDSYIVKFKEGSGLAALDKVLDTFASGDVNHVFRHVFPGFSGKIPSHMLDALLDHPDVEYIQQDQVVSVEGVVDEDGAPWGLGRISHRQKGSTTYEYDDSAGAGTCTYVLDTGVDDSHPDFEGRAKQLTSFLDGENSDGNGHGTHVSGTIASKTYGIAKKGLIFGVKILANSGSGANSNVLKGIDFLIGDKDKRNCPKGVLSNFSLGSDKDQAVNDAVAKLAKAGVFVGVASGNKNIDASKRSPASEPSVCTIGGTAIDDTRYVHSDFGPLVDIHAPGVKIKSLAPGGGTRSMTGTSMATPHAVGVAAYLASLEGLSGSDALCDRLKALATKGAITNQKSNTVNNIAFNGISK